MRETFDNIRKNSAQLYLDFEYLFSKAGMPFKAYAYSSDNQKALSVTNLLTDNVEMYLHFLLDGEVGLMTLHLCMSKDGVRIRPSDAKWVQWTRTLSFDEFNNFEFFKKLNTVYSGNKSYDAFIEKSSEFNAQYNLI